MFYSIPIYLRFVKRRLLIRGGFTYTLQGPMLCLNALDKKRTNESPPIG